MKIPQGVTVTVSEGVAKVKGAKGEVGVTFPKRLSVNVDSGAVKLSGDKRAVYTYCAHIKNAFTGVTEGHKRLMKVLFSHFPMKVEVKGSDIIVKNFLGGKVDRTAKIVGNTTVKVKGQEIEIEGPDHYAVGQTAANIQQITRVKGKDERVFQDGIYVVK